MLHWFSPPPEGKIRNPDRQWWQVWLPRFISAPIITKDTKPKTRCHQRPNDNEVSHEGAAFYLGDLLDRLDRAFADLSEMRKHDRDAYDIFSRSGVSIFTQGMGVEEKVDPYFLLTKPSFSATYLGDRPEHGDVISPTFLYAVKEKRPGHVQPMKGVTVYRCGAVYDDRKLGGKRLSALATFWVAMGDDGTIVPLKWCRSVIQELPRAVRRLPDGSRQGRKVRRMEWEYPLPLRDIAEKNGVSVEKEASRWFCWITNAALAAERGMTVRVKKHKATMAFAIDMLRTPYFFADRDKTVTANGQTKKILHLVRAHTRVGAGGHETVVRSHFRGLRHFEWNGYEVSIGVAGKHGRALSEFGLDPLADDEVDVLPAKRLADARRVGSAFDKVMV